MKKYLLSLLSIFVIVSFVFADGETKYITPDRIEELKSVEKNATNRTELYKHGGKLIGKTISKRVKVPGVVGGFVGGQAGKIIGNIQRSNDIKNLGKKFTIPPADINKKPVIIIGE